MRASIADLPSPAPKLNAELLPVEGFGADFFEDCGEDFCCYRMLSV